MAKKQLSNLLRLVAGAATIALMGPISNQASAVCNNQCPSGAIYQWVQVNAYNSPPAEVWTGNKIIIHTEPKNAATLKPTFSTSTFTYNVGQSDDSNDGNTYDPNYCSSGNASTCAVLTDTNTMEIDVTGKNATKMPIGDWFPPTVPARGTDFRYVAPAQCSLTTPTYMIDSSGNVDYGYKVCGITCT